MNKPVSVRLDDETLKRLDAYAEAMDRSRSWAVNEAIQAHLDHREWMNAEIRKGLEEAEREGDAGMRDHADVMADLEALIKQYT